MERLRISIPNETVCQQVFNKAVALGYYHYSKGGESIRATTVFLDEGGAMTITTKNTLGLVPDFLLEDFKKHIESFPLIEVKEFLKK